MGWAKFDFFAKVVGKVQDFFVVLLYERITKPRGLDQTDY